MYPVSSGVTLQVFRCHRMTPYGGVSLCGTLHVMSPGERLKQVMSDARVSQRSLARKCAANPASTTNADGWRQNISRYRKGGGIDPANAAIMAEELGVSVSEFLVSGYTQAEVERLLALVANLQGFDEPTQKRDGEPEGSDDDYGIGGR